MAGGGGFKAACGNPTPGPGGCRRLTDAGVKRKAGGGESLTPFFSFLGRRPWTFSLRVGVSGAVSHAPLLRQRLFPRAERARQYKLSDAAAAAAARPGAGAALERRFLEGGVCIKSATSIGKAKGGAGASGGVAIGDGSSNVEADGRAEVRPDVGMEDDSETMPDAVIW